MTHTTEIELAAGIIVAAVPIVLLIARFLRRANDQYGRLWGPLAALVNGSAQGSRMTGTYQEMPVTARLTGGGEDDAAYYYELTMTPGPAPSDWSLAFTGEKFLGTGTKTWRVKSKDDDLRQRLTDAGAVAAIQDWPSQPDVTYKGKTGVLTYRSRVGGAFDLPSVEQFQAQLDLMARLSKLNTQVNTG